MYHLALAMQSPNRLVQTQGLTLIKAIAPFTGLAAEQMLVTALEGLPCNAMHATARMSHQTLPSAWHEGSHTSRMQFHVKRSDSVSVKEQVFIG